MQPAKSGKWLTAHETDGAYRSPMASPSKTGPKHIRPKLDDSLRRSHESELTRRGLTQIGRNFPLAYLLMGLPGLLANVPTSRREHAPPVECPTRAHFPACRATWPVQGPR